MSNEMNRRGKYGVYYANITYMGVRLRDCLKTVDRNEAQRRVVDLKLAVERGDYQKGRMKFKDLVAKYDPQVDRKNKLRNLKNHLMPEFGDKLIGELDVESWACRISTTKSETTAVGILRVARELGLDVPKVKFTVKGKRFDENQILEEEQVLDVIYNYVIPKYQGLCLVAAYSTLRLGDLLKLRKKDVDFKKGWIQLIQSKTKSPVSVPFSEILRKAFDALPHPLQDDDRWFPDFTVSGVSHAASTAFSKAGIEWATFHHFRHFGACHMINATPPVPLEVVSRILGHTSIKTTQIYARVKRDTLRNAVKAFDTTQTQTG